MEGALLRMAKCRASRTGQFGDNSSGCSGGHHNHRKACRLLSVTVSELQARCIGLVAIRQLPSAAIKQPQSQRTCSSTNDHECGCLPTIHYVILRASKCWSCRCSCVVYLKVATGKLSRVVLHRMVRLTAKIRLLDGNGLTISCML